ncbi:jg20112 [Pararge aegeria aegeria]|uniref:Jg20112 protein n=5 Tax=Pararge aegeria TaxID=116150 RepID=A0A8S4RFT6_9NEOP|nr:jg20112 [Pararge aegeria aegeria]
MRKKGTRNIMSVGLQRRVPALDEAGGVPAAWKSAEPPFPAFAPPAGSPAGPAFAASPAPATPGPAFAGPYAAAGPFGSPSARPGSGGGFPPAQHFPAGFAPPGSPFHPHAPHPPLPPHPHMMAPLPPPVDR